MRAKVIGSLALGFESETFLELIIAILNILNLV